ncbi:MAG TPA: tRNA (adenosine(37)-N6)-threonylcarbamoyltransferase complex dimerization subunit type 1 TsaB [Tepidisphaeraceae bacterium]|nr:tRNA (adenosine(37)-N6)-threonylcarbamoyltransferase complex dimerization subunit type 1 TsaB [Tepidisphaeraceae bacterium]
MPRAIAIETSGRVGSIAIVNPDSDAPVVEELFPHGLAHAAQVLPMIDRHTRAAGWSPGDVECIYLSIGPGSFTGLRIAVTLAKMMALSRGSRIVAVPSVRVLVENAPETANHAVIVLDAKRGQIFTASFSRNTPGPGTGWLETAPARLDTLQRAIASSPRPVHLLGEGIAYHRESIVSNGDSTGLTDVIVTDESTWRARASVVARLGSEMAARGEFADPWTLTPIYIRLPEAEEKWLQRAQNGAT